MHTLRVGDLYAPGVTRFPEVSHYAWDPIGHAPNAHHRLVAFAERPTPQELVAFRAGGRLDLALLVEGPVLALLWTGAGWTWGEAPYSWHLQAAAHRKAGRGDIGAPSSEDFPDGAGVPLDAWLVDAATGRIAAMRRVAMPGPFARELHRAIAAQAGSLWDADVYDRRLARLVAEPMLSLVARAEARCSVGGAAPSPGGPS